MSHQVTINQFADFSHTIGLASESWSNKHLTAIFSPTNEIPVVYEVWVDHELKYRGEGLKQAIEIYNNPKEYYYYDGFTGRVIKEE